MRISVDKTDDDRAFAIKHKTLGQGLIEPTSQIKVAKNYPNFDSKSRVHTVFFHVTWPLSL